MKPRRRETGQVRNRSSKRRRGTKCGITNERASIATASEEDREASQNRAEGDEGRDPGPSTPLTAARLLDHAVVDLYAGWRRSGYCHSGAVDFACIMKLL
jgi:hypothetical protein